MKYSAGVRRATNSQAPIINLGQDNDADLFIFNLNLKHVYTDFSAPGQITLVGFDRIMPATGALPDRKETIKSGDTIDVFESSDGVNFIPFYSGYVVSTEYIYENSTEMLVLNVDTRLSHWKRQYMIQTFGEVTTLGPGVTGVANTDFASNKVKFTDLVNFLIQGSIFEFVQTFRTFQVIYQSPNINALLGPQTSIWYYPSSQSTKEQVLNSSLFSYQVMCWQDQNGNIVFTAPSENDQSTFNIIKGDPNLRGFRITNAQAQVPNNLVESLVYLGFFPPTTDQFDKNLIAQAIPDPKYFPDSYALYEAGYFQQTNLQINSLQTGIITDPVLLNLLQQIEQISPNSSITPPNGNQTRTMAGLLSARYLAQLLTQSEMVQVELNRNSQTAEIPVGKVIKVDNEPFFCIQCETDLTATVNDNTGQSITNTMILTGVPLRSITGYWYTGG
jgi:hypothetical protein